MAEVEIIVDGKSVLADTQSSLIRALEKSGAKIPSICFHPALKPSGACKLCAVEVRTGNGPWATRLSCAIKPKEHMEIRTDSHAVKQARNKAITQLIAKAPLSKSLIRVAEKFGMETGPLPDGCIRCRLCVRVCRDIVGAAALTVKKTNKVSYITPVPGKCIGCGTCVNLCPTEALTLRDEGCVRTISIRDEIVGTHPLVRCEGCGRTFATPMFLQQTENRVHEHNHPDTKTHPHYCPACAKIFSPRVCAETH